VAFVRQLQYLEKTKTQAYEVQYTVLRKEGPAFKGLDLTPEVAEVLSPLLPGVDALVKSG
jgi:hypothetical protein